MSDSLRGDLEDALRFLNHNTRASRLVQADAAATLTALVETLVAHGLLPQAEYERRRQRALDAQKVALDESPEVQLGPAVDKYAITDVPAIDCAAIIPICKARCCTLTVHCSAQDLDEHVVQWDYSRPYRIRKREDGYCVHSEPDSGRCGIYDKRPAICRTYDCREDKRIWLDFEKRILAER